tara:strand:+ start:102 stop:218 length:117 start_codon:yes stop_codon:yes gene_type:complete
MNNQGKTPQQYRDSSRFAGYSIIGIIVLLSIVAFLEHC